MILEPGEQRRKDVKSGFIFTVLYIDVNSVYLDSRPSSDGSERLGGSGETHQNTFSGTV